MPQANRVRRRRNQVIAPYNQVSRSACRGTPRERKKLEAGQPQRLPIKGHRRRTAGPGAERGGQSVGEGAAPFPQRDRCGEDLLLAFNDEHIGLQRALDRSGDRRAGKPVDALENPDRLGHGHDADEAGIAFGTPPLDQLCRNFGVDRVIVRHVADENIGIERCRLPIAWRGSSGAFSAIQAFLCTNPAIATVSLYCWERRQL
jgi:hypothetical protein